MTRIRVARIITRLNVGGPAIQAMLLTERLDPRRFETLLLTGRVGRAEGDMTRLRPGLARPPVTVPALAREIAPAADARALVALVRILRSFRPHIVHTHMSKAGLLGRVAARLAGVPAVVHTYHGNVLEGYFDPVRTRVFLGLERGLARMSTRIIAISPRQRAEIERLGIARGAQVVEIPLGLELDSFLDPPRGRLRGELGVADDVPLVGIVARLVPIKRVDVFVDACALLARTSPRMRFVVAGDGELRASLERRAWAAGLAGRMTFLGWRSDLPGIYADLDVVALTSDNEGTPVSVIEALAAARPVVATAVGGVPDVLGADERGVLVPRRDPPAVAEAIAGLLEDRARARALALAGRSHVHPGYDAALLVERLVTLYTGLVRTGE